jgi:hypothetical protein
VSHIESARKELARAQVAVSKVIAKAPMGGAGAVLPPPVLFVLAYWLSYRGQSHRSRALEGSRRYTGRHSIRAHEKEVRSQKNKIQMGSHQLLFHEVHGNRFAHALMDLSYLPLSWT